MRRILLGTGLLLGVLGLFIGCAPQTTKQAPQQALYWPAYPEKPRIAHVRSFSRAADLGIKVGLLRRLRDLVLGQEPSHMVRPMAVVETDQVIYVADPGAKGVHRFDIRKGDYRLILGDKQAPLPSPVGLARGANGDVYVTDSRLGRVLLIRAQAKAAIPLSLQGRLLQPTGIAFDQARQQLYVVDTRAHRINVYDAQGKLLRHIGQRGTGPGEFNYPTLLWLSGAGRLYVTDSLNFRIQILERDGRFISKFGELGDASGDAARPKGVATDSQGHVYVVDSLFHAVQIFDNQDGRYLLTVGKQGQQRGEFWLPVGIHINDSDTLYVADTYNQRVQVFRYLGGEL